MGFHNVRFPTNVNYGSSGGPGFSTAITVLRSGVEQRVQRWSSPKRRYDASYTIRTPSDVYTVLEFYIARGGPANTFLYKDWTDYATTSSGSTHRSDDSSVTKDDVEIAVGDGSTTQFQLLKKYTSGGVTASRNIYHPISGTLLIAVDGTLQTETTHYTVNYTTGVVTFVTAPANNLSVTAGFEFDVAVRFAQEVDMSFAASIDSFDSNSVPSIPLVEDVGEVADPEISWNGGSKDFGTTSTAQTVTLSNGRALVFSPSTAHDVILPSTTLIEPGGPIFLIVNDGGSATITLKYSDTTTSVGTVAAGAVAEIWLVENATSGLKEWQLK